MVLSKIDHIPTPSDAHGIYCVYNPNNVSITGIYVHAEDGTVFCLGNPSLWENASNYLGNVYNWYAATDARNIAPVGWHLPSSTEWGELINFAGSPETTVSGIAREAARKLILTGQGLWDNGNFVDNTYTNSLRMNIISVQLYFVEYLAFNNLNNTKFFTSDTATNIGNNYAKCAVFTYNADTDTLYLSDNKTNATYIDTGTLKSLLYSNRKDDGLPIRLIKDDANYEGPLVDYDGNVYNTVKIGNQVWIQSNWKCTKYRNGENIGTIFGIANTGAVAIDNTSNYIKPKNNKHIPSSIINTPVS